jgi:hypothetical protein
MQHFILTIPLVDDIDLALSDIAIISSQKGIKVNLPFFFQIKVFEERTCLFLQKWFFIETLKKLLCLYLCFIP